MEYFYNSQILSHFYLEKQKLNQDKQIEALKRASPIAWPHINIIGKYFFRERSTPLSFANINELVKHDILIDEQIIEEDRVEMAL